MEDGSAAHPYNTITEAAAAAKASDTVQVAEGTYYERNIKTANSGSPGNPITFKGVRGEKSEWLTIIDGRRIDRVRNSFLVMCYFFFEPLASTGSVSFTRSLPASSTRFGRS